MQRSYLERQTSSELLCLPFLDTDTAADLPVADAILRDRGYSVRRVRILRRLCRIGLWHQLAFMWDWACLDVWDVVQGWAMLVVPVALVVAMVVSLPVGLALLAAAVAAFLGAAAGMVRARNQRGG